MNDQVVLSILTNGRARANNERQCQLAGRAFHGPIGHVGLFTAANNCIRRHDECDKRTGCTTTYIRAIQVDDFQSDGSITKYSHDDDRCTLTTW